MDFKEFIQDKANKLALLDWPNDMILCFIDGAEQTNNYFGWHPASELPVIPEGKNWVKVVALVDFGDNTLRPRHEIYKDKGWSKKDMWTVKYWCYPPKED